VKQKALQRARKRQAFHLLEYYWSAVEELAVVLVKRGRLRGWEAHRVIQEVIDPPYTDWRMDGGKSGRGGADCDEGLEAVFPLVPQ
jgi:hypothetical protein